ncbi:MAG: FIST N-terminal domain-containing protein [Flavobacteriaceae bacterium]|nr:FIST C-terminal domain-containing protein [Flavobacteriaceae bacterium]
MKSKSIKGHSTAEIKKALSDSMEDAFKPTLAIVFMSISQDRKAIAKLLDEKNIAVFGCTTNGEFIDENPDTKSITVLLMDLNPDYFEIYFEEYTNKKYRDVSTKIANKANSKFKKPAFLIGISGASTDGEEVLRGLEDVNGSEINAFGGGAGDDYAFTETFVFTNNKESNNAMVCIVLDESKVKVKGIATCGWKAVGTEKIVTKSEGNHVYTIDNVPALDITVKYGGLENITPNNKDLLVELAANFPLQLQRSKGDPLMRPGLVVDWTDRSFYTSGTVPQGSKVRFSLPPDWDVMEKVVKGVQHLKDTEMPEADALIVFSCAGRILSLGPMMSEEIEGIKNVWNVPMAGMFSNAELGRATGGNLEMHNLTTCCVALKEK